MKAGILRTIVVAAFLAALAACEKEPDGPDEPDLPPQATLRILTESVTMTPGGDTYVEFRISPFETQFNYDIGSGKCAITLTDRGGNEPKEVKIYKIEPTSDNPSDQGKYKVFLEDALVKVSFEQIFRITYRDPFGRVSTSGDFKVTCQCDELSRSLLATGLTLVNITTDGGVEPTCEYVSHPEGCNGAGIKNATKVPGNLIIMKGEEILYSSGPYKKDESGMTVKIRGNTSAYPTKKPYKIKLEKKKDLLHRGDESRYKDKEWLLLKYDDLKSMAGFFVNQYLGIQWTPAYEFVNVVINGNYRGLYMLTEAVKRNDSCRLNVAKDGYVIEYDAYWWNEEVSFTGGWNYSMQYTFKYPESDEVTKEQKDYIRSYIVKVEKKIKDLVAAHRSNVFNLWLEQGKITCKPNYALSPVISPTSFFSTYPKSLYSSEEDVNDYERKVVWALSSMDNIKWWHRNISRLGFQINGAIHAYPDIMALTTSGKILMIETKGDHLENDESKAKAKIGHQWDNLAGPMYRYFMVFQTKSPDWPGAYSYDRFMEIVKEL